jgi:dephospho-CoA kinase
MHDADRVIIGVAGNVGTGKTTVCRIFESFGARYISADEVGWEVLPEISKALKRKFGDDIMTGDAIDRSKLRTIVFSKRENLDYLNKISHPILVNRILTRIDNIKMGIIIIDAALLFDWPEIRDRVDYSILVTADDALKEMRAMRKGIDKKLLRQILSYQEDEAEMSLKANFIIKNNGTVGQLKEQCKSIYKEIKNDC